MTSELKWKISKKKHSNSTPSFFDWLYLIGWNYFTKESLKDRNRGNRRAFKVTQQKILIKEKLASEICEIFGSEENLWN